MTITYESAVDAMVSCLPNRCDLDPDRYADSLSDILLAAVRA